MGKIWKILALVLFAFPYGAFSQVVKEYRNIGIDSLMVLMKGECSQRVFYVAGEDSRNVNFTVEVPQGKSLLEQIKYALSEKGYSVVPFEGNILVLKGVGLTESLPGDYFALRKAVNAREVAKDYIDAMENVQNMATVENKVYRIGSRQNAKGGKAYLSGYVRDSRTGEPVAGVTLYDKSSNVFAQSDANGFYRLLLASGERELAVSGYSYEDSRFHLEVFGDGSLDIVIKEKVFSLGEVVVSAEGASNVRGTEMGIERIRIDKIKNVPTVLGETDIVKIILTLPGVKSVGEAASGFNVRGGATDQNLVLFNGGTVYNPSHLFGMFSGFNPDIAHDIELYKCSIPVEYGGRISSVLDVKSREGNSKNMAGSLSAGLLTAKGHIEGPAGDRTTFIAAARATYSDWLLGLLPQDSEYRNGTASFYDITAGVTHKFNERNSIQLNGYLSEDAFKFSVDTSYRYSNMNASLRWNSNFSDRNSMVATVGYDRYGYSTVDDFYSTRAYELSYNIGQIYGKVKLKTLLNDRHSLVYGADAIHYDILPGKYMPYGEESLVIPKIMGKENAVEGALYVSDVWNVSERLSLDYGARFSLFSSDKFYCGPELRLSGRYLLDDGVSLKFGFNSMKQYIHMLSNTVSISPTDTWKLSDKDIKPQSGWQLAGGLYASVFQNKVDASLEVYWKRMRNYLDYKSGAVILMNEDIAKDVVPVKGQAYGVELMLKKPLGKLNGWVSYTYSRTRLKEDSDRGIAAINKGKWYNASSDKPHEIKLVGNYKFTHRVSLSVNGDYATGRPVTVPAAKYYYGGGFRLYFTERNSYRIPDYFRIDASINIEPTHRIKAFTHFSFTLGVYNVTGRKNVYSVFFENAGTKVNGYKMSVFGSQIPYLTLNFKF